MAIQFIHKSDTKSVPTKPVAQNPEALKILRDEIAKIRTRPVEPQVSNDEFRERVKKPPNPYNKIPVKLRLDPEVVEFFRATGKGWQTRMNDVLLDAIRGQK
jgi:uncharacterized protein (DUF4415 family)